MDVSVKSYERQIMELLSENRVLKEESSSQLTQLNGMKETNFKLNQLVSEYKVSWDFFDFVVWLTLSSCLSLMDFSKSNTA